jgi:Lon-like protease
MKRPAGLPLMLIAVVIAALVNWIPSGYYLIRPGGTYEIEPRLEIPEEHRQEMGRLAFTAVRVQPGSWVDLVGARLSGMAEIVPAEEVRPQGVSPEQLNEINRRLMQESQSVAAVVGLRAAGYDARVTGQGARVVNLLENMPAADVLQEGDIIVAIDDQPVQTAVEAIELIRRHEIGDQVSLTVLRGGQQLDAMVGTKGSPAEPRRPAIGASISTHLFDIALPFPVEFDISNVGGPSAGLMFALGILDAVTHGVLTDGYFVAGTGTIAADGTVGPIGGAAEKVIAAERDGAQIFLVPTRNLDDARRTARSAQIVAVERFDDAVRFLCGLEPQSGSSAPQPAPCAQS